MRRVALFSALSCIVGLGATAHADSVTYSGAALSGLVYVGNLGDAQYVAGTPDVAELYTPDSGTADSADSPAVFVQGPMGTVNDFSASYVLSSFTGPANTEPYWNIQVSPDANPSDTIEIISSGGTPLTSSSLIHAYGPGWSSLPDNGYWGDTLSQLGAITFDGYTIGDMTVNWAGVEIGDWNNNGQTIASTADFSSITVPAASAPVPATDLGGIVLLGGLGLFSGLKRCRRGAA